MLGLAACSHSEPFTGPDTDTDVPFADAEPARLTYADGAETEPAWLPDGSAFVYSFDRLGTSEGDRCLTTMPATGGTIEREFCNPTADDEFLADVYATPSVFSDSTLAFFYSAAVGLGVPGVQGLYVAPYQDPGAKRAVRTLPFTGPSGTLYASIGSVTWVGPDRVGFIGIAQATVQLCPTCDAFVVAYGRDLLVIVPSDPTSVVRVPGVDFPTSLTSGETADIIYYTLAADTRIYRRVLSTGATTVVYDFTTAGIVRDLHYSAGQLAAIVGGQVAVFNEPVGPLQQSGAGLLYVVTVATATAQLVAGSPFTALYQNPAIAPDGSSIVAEGYGPASPGGNLWLFRSQ
jgi:hypothetical protein